MENGNKMERSANGHTVLLPCNANEMGEKFGTYRVCHPSLYYAQRCIIFKWSSLKASLTLVRMRDYKANYPAACITLIRVVLTSVKVSEVSQ